MVSMPVIPFGTVEQYLKMQKVIALQDNAPEQAQLAAAALARGSQKVLSLVGIQHPVLDGLAVKMNISWVRPFILWQPFVMGTILPS